MTKNRFYMAVAMMALMLTLPTTLPNAIAQSNNNIIENVERKTGVKVASQYRQKLQNFTSNNEVMKDKEARDFTEGFIVGEMKKDWKVSKANQLLFIWGEIYRLLTDTPLYNGKDGNSQRTSEYNSASAMIDKCNKRYVSEFKSYMAQLSAEYDRRSAESRQRTAEYNRQTAESRQRTAEYNREIIETTKSRLDNLVRFYNLYRKNPRSVMDSEINKMKDSAKEIVQDCKKYNINYKIKLTPAMQRFYGIE